MKKTTLFFLCALAAAPAAADVLYLNKGDEVSGDLLRLDAKSAVMRVAGEEKTFGRADALKLQFVKEYAAGFQPARDLAMSQLLAAPPKPEEYPNDGYLNWLREVNITVSPDKSWTVSKRNLRYVLRERGKSPAAYYTFFYLPDIQKTGIEHAYSVTDSSVSWLTDLSVMEGSAYLAYPEYDRLKLTKFAIPNVQIGSALDSRFRIGTVHRSTYPFFEAMAFRAFEPARAARLTVTVPKGLDLAYRELNMPKERVFAVEDRGDARVYTWLVRDAQSYKSEPSPPPFMRYAPYVLLSLASTWDALRAEFAPLVRARLNITPAIAAKAAELTAGKGSGAEKIEALYNWTASEIKFQPVDMEEYSFLPRDSGGIFEARAGNALDKPFLLYALLTAAGFRAEFAYAQSKYSVFADDLPNIRQFDHGECLLELDGKTLALAPLDDRHRYTELPSVLHGAPALRVLGGDDRPALLANPDPPADEQASAETEKYELTADGDLSGEIELRMTGEHQASLRGYKDYKKEDLDKAMESYVHGLHPQARLKDYTIVHLHDLSRDLQFRVSFTVKGYAMSAGRHMILKLPGLDYSASDVSQPERELPMFWYSRSRTSGKVTMKLPAGYNVYYVPPDLKAGAAGQSFSASYRAGKGELTFEQELRRDSTQVETADYPKYKAFKEKMAQFTENWIVLEKE